jgi:hypothetical protein
LFERRGNLVLDYFNAGFTADYFFAFFHATDTTNI